MRDDYLWDKTGEVDPEIQHLERVLGSLRHSRTSKELPAIIITPRRRPRTFPKMMAIAAVLAFAALSLVAFAALRLNRRGTEERVAMANIEPSQPVVAASKAPAQEVSAPPPQYNRPAMVKVSSRQTAPLPARRRNISRSREAYDNEQAEGLMAKERLLKALEITSSKLSDVQKKVKASESLGPTS